MIVDDELGKHRMALRDGRNKVRPDEIHRSLVTEAIISGERVSALFKAGQSSFDRIFSDCGDCGGGPKNISRIIIFNFNFINAGRNRIRRISAGVIPRRVIDFNINIFAAETEVYWRTS